MKCPICGSKGLKTTNSRPTHSDSQTWRRKQCPACQSIITTYEKTDMLWLNIKDPINNKLLPYKKPLLYKSLLAVFNDDEIMEFDFENLINSIEQKIVSNQKTIITKNELVKIVLTTLEPLSLPAYVKYLSSHSRPQNKRELARLIKQI